jgi:hypothetical protein
VLDLALRLVRFEHVEAVLGLQVCQARIMQQIDVDGVNAEPLQTALDTAADVIRGEIACAGHHIVAAFGAHNKAVAVRAFLEEGADDTLAVPSTVGVRGIDEVHPGIDSRMQRLQADCVLDRAKDAADSHGPESDHAHLQASASESALLHR